MSDPNAADVTRTLVLAGFAVLALMGVATLAVILYLYAVGREVPQGLVVVFTATGAVMVTTFAGIVKDYVGRNQ